MHLFRQDRSIDIEIMHSDRCSLLVEELTSNHGEMVHIFADVDDPVAAVEQLCVF